MDLKHEIQVRTNLRSRSLSRATLSPSWCLKIGPWPWDRKGLGEEWGDENGLVDSERELDLPWKREHPIASDIPTNPILSNVFDLNSMYLPRCRGTLPAVRNRMQQFTVYAPRGNWRAGYGKEMKDAEQGWNCEQKGRGPSCSRIEVGRKYKLEALVERTILLSVQRIAMKMWRILHENSNRLDRTLSIGFNILLYISWEKKERETHASFFARFIFRRSQYRQVAMRFDILIEKKKNLISNG